MGMMILEHLIHDLLWLVRLPKRALKYAAWWLVWNVRLGDRLSSIICGIALWRRGKKMEIRPNPFTDRDTDVVVVSRTEHHNGIWTKCRHCKGGFLAFTDYKSFEELVVYAMGRVPGRETMCQIAVVCPNCRKKNHYWFYEQAIKDLYGEQSKKD